MFKVVQPNAKVRGGRIFGVVEAEKQERSTVVCHEVKYVEGTVGQKRIRVADLDFSPFNDVIPDALKQVMVFKLNQVMGVLQV